MGWDGGEAEDGGDGGDDFVLAAVGVEPHLIFA
jgi:hypothetical protein